MIVETLQLGEGTVRRLRGSADGTYAHQAQLLRELARDMMPGEPLLVDLRDIHLLPSTAEVDLLANLLASRHGFGGSRVAVLVDKGAQWGIARMISTMVELRGGHAKAFQDEEVAMTWVRP